MRLNPEEIDRTAAEQSRLARDKFAAERESYRAEAEGDQHHVGPAFGGRPREIHFDAPEAERAAFKVGLRIGARDERNRIVEALTRLEQETAALWFEGSAVTRAVAAYTAAVRRVVEGGK